MKQLLKSASLLTAVLLVLGACSTSTNGTVVGSVNARHITINHYEEIFPTTEAEETSENNESSTVNEETSENNETSTVNEESSTGVEEAVDYDETSAMLVGVFGAIFQETGNWSSNKKEINTALNNVKANYGDSYLSEAASNYGLPIKNDADLVEVLSFSISYSDYLEKMANITDDNVSEEYYKSYKTKYCASHILVETEKEAKTLLSKIENGEKTFDDYTAEAQAAYDEQNADSTATSTLSVNDIKISGVEVSQFADLSCQPASTYVGEFAEALETMDANTISTTPVKTEYGYHIIQLREIEENELTKALQDEIYEALLSAKQSTSGFSSYYLKKLVDEVDVEITDEKIKEIYDEYIETLDTSAASFTPEDEEATTDNNEDSTTNNESTSNNEETTKNN